MRSSEDTDLLSQALSEAQGEYPIVPKAKEAVVPTKSGGEYRYRYADLADAVEAARPVNAKHGLSVSQMPGWDGTTHTLDTRVMHTSGQWLEGTMKLILPQETPQVHGSALTYARRYAYCAALGIVTDTDDDGQLAEMAYGSNSSRSRKPAKSSTSTGGKSRGTRPVDPATDDGQAAFSARDRNKVISHFARGVEPPILGDPAVDAEVARLLGEKVPLVKLSAAQGHLLMVKLGLVEAPEQLALTETPEERDKRVAAELKAMETQSEEPF